MSVNEYNVMTKERMHQHSPARGQEHALYLQGAQRAIQVNTTAKKRETAAQVESVP